MPLIENLRSRQALVGVVGLGYVGLPVATALAQAGFDVLGVDKEVRKVEPVLQGVSHIRDVPHADVEHLRHTGRLHATTSYDELSGADAILICVPTPLTNGAPDVSAIEAVGQALSGTLSPGTLVVLESTTYPGTTEEVLKPLLEESGLVADRDFLLAFSPERIDPGNLSYGFGDIPKIVGGISRDSTRAAEVLYEQVVPKVVTVSGPSEAEMAKLVENIFRHVNIALVNELAVYAHELDIDIWEVIEAAATKPFGYMPFWPSPGWGGHCIPLDPSFLSWRVRQSRAHEIRFVELAHNVNSEMPRYVLDRAMILLNDEGRAMRGARILGVGMAYKGGTEDTRGSPGVKVLKEAARRGAIVSYFDPLVPEVTFGDDVLRSVNLSASTFSAQDLVLIFTSQADVDWSMVGRHSRQILDCCNALHGQAGNVAKL